MNKSGRPSFLTRSKSYEIRNIRMIRIPEGPFTMGLSEEQVLFLLRSEDWAEEWQEWYDNDLFLVEQPQHIVYLPEYYIAQYPVTNADYFAFVWQTGYRMPRTWSGFYYPDGTADHPVTGVSRQDVLAYIEWLNRQTGLNYRLPTEAEWEKAARGDMDARIYPWGDEFGLWRCNTKESGKFSTTPVGSYSPSGDSPYCVADMVGNVWEWTSSLFRPYPYNPNDGRETPNDNEKYVVRGGSWYYSRKLARCTVREGVIATYASPALGFRLALSA
jgi:formylglycine-generating enzyme required for sulfatase activity